MPSVAKETDIPMAQLESIQHGLRVCISLLEVLAAVRPRQEGAEDGTEDGAAVRAQLVATARRMQSMLIGMARALVHGVPARLAARGAAVPAMPALSGPWAGYLSLTQRLECEFAQVREALAATAGQWNL